VAIEISQLRAVTPRVVLRAVYRLDAVRRGLWYSVSTFGTSKYRMHLGPSSPDRALSENGEVFRVANSGRCAIRGLELHLEAKVLDYQRAARRWSRTKIVR
jgi:hypothetical protein